jgi:NitT/TauT family transport system substrate-binding protein
MRRRTLLTRGLTAALGAALLAPLSTPRAVFGAARGEAVRIIRPLDLSALPLLIVEHERLIERTAEAMGLGQVAVSWRAPDKIAGLDALAAGQTDFAAAELVPFLAAADREAGGAAGGASAIRALGAVAQRPYVLVTRNPAIHTIRDFGQTDRIAVPAVKLSGPAIMLDMAAAQEWGIDHADKLAALALAMPDDSATAALIAGKGPVTAHFSQTPYVDRELAEPAISRVMDSFDIAGPHTGPLLAATAGFRDGNRELCKAVLSALQQAGEFIENNPGAAAEIFSVMVKDDDTPPEVLSDMIGDPDLAYAAAPSGVMRIAGFMHRTGRLRRLPAGWQEFFLPEARDLPGS